MRAYLRFGVFLVVLPILPFLLKTIWQVPTRAFHNETQVSESTTHIRTHLLMALDLLVKGEQTIRRETSSFTRALGRVPDVLGSVAQFYKIDIVKSSRSSLLVVAVGERGKSRIAETVNLDADRVAIDEGFHVVANFPLPPPPRDYLHTLARVVMNQIFLDNSRVLERKQIERWEGVFHGYFRYEVRSMSQGGRTIVAVGKRSPVAGDIVDMQTGANLYEWVYNYRHSVWLRHEIEGRLEKLYLAEHIYRDHVGFYCSSFRGLVPQWNELAVLSNESQPLRLQEFQEDPTFGFHAEIGYGPGQNERRPASLKAWSVNGYGQIAEVSSIESLVTQFERAKRQIESHGEGLKRLQDDLTAIPRHNPNPLLIDRVEEK